MYRASTRRAITSVSTLKSQSKPSPFDVKKTKRFTSKLLQPQRHKDKTRKYKQKRRRKGIKGAGKLKEK
jgi:hypothetical protein